MKIKYYLLSLFLFFLLIINVNAASLSIESIVPGTNETTFDIVMSGSNEAYNKVSFAISTSLDSSMVGLESYTLGTDPFSQDIKTSGISYIYSKSGNLKDNVIAHIKLTNRTKDVAYTSVTLESIKFYEDTTETEGENYTKSNIKLPFVANSSAKLSKLSNNSGTLSPVFTPDTTSYKMYLKDTIQNVSFNLSCEQSGCSHETICVSGCTVNDSTPDKVTLAMGKNVVKFSVKSQDTKNTKDYMVTIYRGDTTDGSNLLKSLSIQGFTFKEKFDKNTVDYTATVDYDHENVTVNAEPEDSNADVQIKGDTNLQVGENVITVTVKSAETGESKIYNINVTREDFKAKSSTTVAAVTNKSKSKMSKKLWLLIIIAVVGLLIIAAAAYFIFFKGNKKEKITKDGKIKKGIDEKDKDLSVKDNDLVDTLEMPEVNEKPSVDDALADLMETKELEFTKDMHYDDK